MKPNVILRKLDRLERRIEALESENEALRNENARRKSVKTPTPESPLLSMKQAAEYPGASLRVIRQLTEDNAFKVIPLAGVIKTRKQTRDAWLEFQEVYRTMMRRSHRPNGSNRSARTGTPTAVRTMKIEPFRVHAPALSKKRSTPP